VILEERGIATATICTEEFAHLGKLEASALGVPYLPIIVVPHPVADLKPEEVHALAERVFGEIVYALTEPREKLMAELRDKTYPMPSRVFAPRPVFAR